MGIAVYGGRTEKAAQAFLKANGGVKQNLDPEVRTFTMVQAKQARFERMEAEKRKQAEYLELTRKQARDDIRKANQRLALMRRTGSFDLIVMRICKALRVTPLELIADRRNVEVVLARQAIFYWGCRRTRLSLPEIGRRIGGRDHTTVLHGKNVYPKKRAKMGRYLREAR